MKQFQNPHQAATSHLIVQQQSPQQQQQPQQQQNLNQQAQEQMQTQLQDLQKVRNQQHQQMQLLQQQQQQLQQSQTQPSAYSPVPPPYGSVPSHHQQQQRFQANVSAPGQQNYNFPIAAPRNSRISIPGSAGPNNKLKHGSPGRNVGYPHQLPPGVAGNVYHQYYPNLSGSETDVSTSTENLTQEERFLLRHMEREEPQGEETQASLAHFNAYVNAQGGFNNQQQISAVLAHRQQQQQQLQLAQISSNMSPRVATPVVLTSSSTSRMATPTATPTYSHPLSVMDTSTHNSSILQDEIWASKIAAVGRSQGGVSGSSKATPTLENKLNPSVYSQPSVQDPVLLMSPHHHSFPLSVLGGKRQNVEMTSSGAFFDPKAVTNAKKDFNVRSTESMISQLAKEMKLNQIGELSSSSVSSNMQNLLSGSSDGSNSALNVKTTTSQQTENEIPNSSASAITTTSANTNARSTSTSSSGYRSENNSFGSDKHLLGNNNNNNSTSNTPALSLMPSENLSPNNSRSKKTPDKLTLLSRSQPDLFTGLDHSTNDHQPDVSSKTMTVQQQQHSSSHEANVNTSNYVNVLEMLQNENRHLRMELEELMKKVEKVSVLEQELTKIHSSYQGLLKHSEKRESLEKAARQKLQNVIINLTEVNKEVTERHESVMAHLMSGDPKNQNIPGLDGILRGEIMRKDNLITQLMNQNKMLMSTKERQDVEMIAQQETLEEQRAHIHILDTALSNSQSQILRLEEEIRIKEGYADRVKQMTRSLEQLQAASEKREAMEKKLRAKLEEELQEYRDMEEMGNRRKDSTSVESLDELRRKFSEAEEKIIRLESERFQWEQRYLEESAMRQVAIDAASIPKDAKIAALEKNSAESEKIIAEARSVKMRQVEEMQNSQRKISDMDFVIKNLETSLAEQTALVRILQTNASVAAVSARMSVAGGGSSGDNALAILAAARENGQQQQQHQQQQHGRQLSHLGTPTGPSPTHHAKQLSTPIYANKPSSPALTLLRTSGGGATTVTDFLRYQGQSQQQHIEQHYLRSPASSAAGLTITYTDIMRSPVSAGLAVSQTDILRSPLVASSSSSSSATQPQPDFFRRTSPLPVGLSVSHADILRAIGHSEMLRTSDASATNSTASAYRPLHLTHRDLLQQQQRSATPTADLLRSSTTPIHFDMNAGRRDSAPGEILAHSLKTSYTNNHTLGATSSLATSNQMFSTPMSISSGNGGTVPKISIAALRDSAINRSSSQFSVQSANNNNSSNFIDDSIDSIMGPFSSTQIDHGQFSPRHDPKQSLNTSKGSFMEVWRV